MADTPKRRLLRKNGLQASPFAAPIRTVLSNSNSNSNSNHDSLATSSTTTKTPPDIITGTPMANPFLTSSGSDSTAASAEEQSSSAENTSPTRRSARLSSIYNSNQNSLTNNGGSGVKTPGGKPTPKRLVPPTTPKTKTILRTGIWGHIVGLKKQDDSPYARYPIDKSYCSFGRGDTCDIRVQIDAVSVWLKDTSTNGTLLNDVLVHDTARPIQHNDIMTIAGRKFRFEAESSTSDNTPGRQVNSNNNNPLAPEILSLADMPSPSFKKFLSTPSKASSTTTPATTTATTTTTTTTTTPSASRKAEALESSLGLFTPNRADRLSRLLVSPKPVPFPAFLGKSPSKASTPRRVFVMIDEPSILNPSTTTTTTCSADEDSTATESASDKIECGLETPRREKRMASLEFDVNGIARTPKKVSFGPALSPEIFDKSEPPSTPIKRGQQDPGTPRRQAISTPCLISSLREAIETP
ncbi:hypothetical protein BGX31_008456 [Mortierella sp. GBA43]|nr:hypothetical protein BGX31_008456 [Mortierella sp. GBA43]